MEKDYTINFTDILNIQKGEKPNEFKYFLKNSKCYNEISEKNTQFVDPSYDSVFKTVFMGSEFFNGKNGKDRLLNLLNSLIFPKEKGIKFTNLSYNSNESNALTIKKSDVLRFDISCDATITISDEKNKKSLTIDIEMQIGKDDEIIERLFKYGSSLYRETKKKTMVIAIINHTSKSKNCETQYLTLCKFDSDGNLKEEKDFFQIIVINLRQELEKIEKGEKIIIKKKELDENGICWIKLLGIRNWGKNIGDFYVLPKNIIFPCEEIKSAYLLLKQIDEIKLQRYINEEEFQISALKSKKTEGIKEHTLTTLIEIFRNKKDLFESLIDFIDKEKTIFEEKEIKEILKESSECKQFIELLGKKRKIE